MALGAQFVAPLNKRITAEAIDAGIVLFAAIMIVDLFVDWDSASPLRYSVPAFLYVAYNALFLHVWEGETPGRRVMNVRVVRADIDDRLSLAQEMGRPAVRLGLILLAMAAANYSDVPITIILPVAVDVLLILMGVTRQSMPDIICRTLVISLPPVQPHRAPAGPMYSATDAEFGVRPKRV